VTTSVEYGCATIARAEGALEQARTRLHAVLALMQRTTLAPQFHATVKSTLALVEAALGDLPTARELHTEALKIATESRDCPVVAQVLVGVADYALRDGDPARAAWLLGAAEGVRGWIDRSASDVDRLNAGTRAGLGDARFDEAHREGKAVTLDAAAAAAALTLAAPPA
jgi:ATP/maltotriose-dependent transcriptional regulator MalT